MVIDASETTYAALEGSRLEIIENITSGIPGKFRAGGQSARRFERQREAKMLAYFKRIGEHANSNFLPLTNLKGLLIGGPGPTKYDFQKGAYLHYTLKDKIISVIDTAYTSEQGVEEVVERSPKILLNIRYVEEKKIIQAFLYEIGHDTGLATYGESVVRRRLESGVVKTLFLSEDLPKLRVTIGCTTCSYRTKKTIEGRLLADFEESISELPCPECNSSALEIVETKDLVEDLAELAEEIGASVEVISTETEEGQMLKKSFGGIAAILRYKVS
jgi:peptide chain release factor subunit 1